VLAEDQAHITRMGTKRLMKKCQHDVRICELGKWESTLHYRKA
jgi:hypothetical protein